MSHVFNGTVGGSGPYRWGKVVDWERLGALTPPAQLRLADGTDVPHEIGTEVYNYYDHRAGVITGLATRAQPDNSGLLPDGAAWWVDTTAGYVDGSRMVSMATARAKGWLS